MTKDSSVKYCQKKRCLKKARERYQDLSEE